MCGDTTKGVTSGISYNSKAKKISDLKTRRLRFLPGFVVVIFSFVNFGAWIENRSDKSAVQGHLMEEPLLENK